MISVRPVSSSLILSIFSTLNIEPQSHLSDTFAILLGNGFLNRVIPKIMSALGQRCPRHRSYSQVLHNRKIIFSHAVLLLFSLLSCDGMEFTHLHLQTASENADYLVMLGHSIAAVKNKRTLGKTLQHFFIRSKLCDVHNKTQLFHPAFHRC